MVIDLADFRPRLRWQNRWKRSGPVLLPQPVLPLSGSSFAFSGPASCQLHHGLLSPDGLGPLCRSFGSQLRIAAVAVEYPGLATVAQRDIKKLPEFLFGCPTGHRSGHFDTSRQITKHPIGRANIELALNWIFMTGGKVENARMFQKAAIERMRIPSLRPGTPGRRQQKPRTTRSTGTPAQPASHRASIISGSSS